MKKIVVTTSPRYEAELVESFCRHSLQFSDMILVNAGVNHADNTQEILNSLKAEGLNIEFYHSPQGICPEDLPLDMVKHAFDKYGADLVLPFDPDEFLFHVDGVNPRPELEKLPEDLQTLFAWETYVYKEEPVDDTRFLPLYFSERRTQEALPSFKTSIHKSLFTRQKTGLTEGRHQFTCMDTEFDLPGAPSPVLRLAHYPLRNMAQAMSKVLTGRLYYISRELGSSKGFQWINMYDSIKATGTLSFEQLRTFSLYYGAHPKARDKFTLRDEVLPARYYEWPKLRYTSYTCGDAQKQLLSDLLIRMEEIIQTLLRKKNQADHFINWHKLREFAKRETVKLKRSIRKRLGKAPKE